ncbi:hypothetical protein Y032_0035g3030 [Ancylostoma ceylanicum]|uniref:SCP domain-containing protein n=1 Tax=Ancylostoma ceylanicum TaxID=53326 RepID=A0A016UM10_9BILA|nr:hypothetical protein Y032_0035g3030 [Ancylostoma ceylanicum]
MRSVLSAFPAILLSLFAVSVGTEFKCTNSLISDQWREKILTVQNDNRRRLAQGKQKGKDNNMLKPAKNMQELVWDCALEDAAYEAAAACTDPPTAPTMPPAQPGQQGQKCGAVSSMIKAKSKSCDATAVVEKELKDIWKAGAAKQADKTVAADNNAFSQMAYCKTNGVGCSYNWCSGKLYLVCFYNNEATAGDLYEEGDTCSKCPPNDDSSNCFVGLCRVDPTVYAPASKICTDPALANANLMTDELRHEALNMHNYYRRLLATGWAEDKKLKYAKPAAAMPELKYNCEVEDEIMGKLKDCPGAVATITKAQANNFKLFTPYTATRQEALSECRVWNAHHPEEFVTIHAYTLSGKLVQAVDAWETAPSFLVFLRVLRCFIIADEFTVSDNLKIQRNLEHENFRGVLGQLEPACTAPVSLPMDAAQLSRILSAAVWSSLY